MINGVQVKMARAALGWGVRELAAAAGINPNTVTRFENGGGANMATVKALTTTLKGAGIIFIAENGGGPGVRLTKQKPGEDA